MANPFYNAMVGKSAPQPQMSIFEAAQQFKKNPIGFLMQKKLNVPANIANNPNAIMNYLLSTGQITQAQIDAGKTQLNNFQNGGVINHG